MYMPIINRQNASDEDMLYEFYSLDFLKYLMDMLNGLKSRLDVLLPPSDPISHKKVRVFRYEIVERFCQPLAIFIPNPSITATTKPTTPLQSTNGEIEK